MRKVICIGRQYGSGGYKLARTLAERLNIPYYDNSCNDLMGLNKLCKCNKHQNFDNTKIAAKQGDAEECPDAGCGIKR